MIPSGHYRHIMKKLLITIATAFISVPFLMQCASQDDLNRAIYQLQVLNKKVTDLEAVTLDDLQKRQAQTVSQIDRLQADLLALKSGLEETGHLNRRLNEQSKELASAFHSYTQQEEEKRTTQITRLEQEIVEKDRQLEMIAEQLRTQQENLQAIQQARVEEAKRKAELAAQAAEDARRRAATARTSSDSSAPLTISPVKVKKVYTAATQPSPSASQPSSTEEVAPAATSATAMPSVASTNDASISKGKSLFDQGKFREAYTVFEGLAKSSDSEEAVNARYMMGECLFSLKEYDQAILDYQTIITNYSSTAKAPAAMLRQAQSFERLNDQDTAKILYKKLIASYKNSPEADEAQKKLGSL